MHLSFKLNISRKNIHFASYTEALQFAKKVDELSTIMGE